VRDNGIGIPPRLLPRLFELFTQVDQASHRTLGGLGIGLALVRRLVEMHGGTVSARSDGANCGSEFRVALPLLAPASAHSGANPRSSAQIPAGVGATRRVLLADDNPDALNSLSRLLACEGHEVHTTVDGNEALELAEQWQPEVALLDVGMAKLDAYELARRIRELPWGKETVLISLAGWDHDEELQRSVAAGFDSHFTKPLDHASLTDWLARLPAGSRLQARN
jgi:CheY-like chemotaxis protein